MLSFTLPFFLYPFLFLSFFSFLFVSLFLSLPPSLWLFLFILSFSPSLSLVLSPLCSVRGREQQCVRFPPPPPVCGASLFSPWTQNKKTSAWTVREKSWVFITHLLYAPCVYLRFQIPSSIITSLIETEHRGLSVLLGQRARGVPVALREMSDPEMNCFLTLLRDGGEVTPAWFFSHNLHVTRVWIQERPVSIRDAGLTRVKYFHESRVQYIGRKRSDTRSALYRQEVFWSVLEIHSLDLVNPLFLVNCLSAL